MCFGAEEFSGNGTLVATKPVVSDLPQGNPVQVFLFHERNGDNTVYIARNDGIFYVDGTNLRKSFTFKTVASLVSNPEMTELSTYAAPVAGDDDDADEEVVEPFSNMSTEEFAAINAEIFQDAGLAPNERDINLTMAVVKSVMVRMNEAIGLLGILLSPESKVNTSPNSISKAVVELLIVALNADKVDELADAADRARDTEQAKLDESQHVFDSVIRQSLTVPSSYGN